MFEIWTLGIGAAVSAVLAILKLCAVIALGWLGVSAALLIALAVVLIKHGVDVADLLPD